MLRPLTALTLATLMVAGCSDGGSNASSTSAGSSSTTSSSTTPSTGSSTAPASGGTTSNSTTPASSSSPATSGSCEALADSLSPAQRAGQLVMVAMYAGSPGAVDSLVTRQHVGNVFLLGNWSGSSTVSAATSGIQRQATKAATGGIGMLVAADQEGGQVQVLRGAGFSRWPSALAQGQLSPDRQSSIAQVTAAELKSAGVNVDLAPVADTVPDSIGAANQPIGRWSRQFGSDPNDTAPTVARVVRGLQSSGVQATLKHFPGLGRITGNTEFKTAGITDIATDANDPALKPFSSGISAGAGLVMVSSARYPKLDSGNAAIFSSAVIRTLLRGQLHFGGVVVSDDLNAVAVQSVPGSERAVRMVQAGGDIALTGSSSLAVTMTSSLVSRAGSDPSFAATMRSAVVRVLHLKAKMGLTTCH